MSEETTPNTQLPVLQNRAPQEMVVAQRATALSRLFKIKPKTLELVSKSTRQDGATPGTFRVTSTNESFKEMRAVILFNPLEQRQKYRKGEYTKDSKECFSLDNVQPHPNARTPFALYCANCPMGDINWIKYREMKTKGIKGDALAAYLPPCQKFWHLFIASRETQRPYYFNVKGGSVRYFEEAMGNVADLMQMMVQDVRTKNKQLKLKGEPLLVEPKEIEDIIWKISFTMYSFQKDGGPFTLGLKDFKVMTDEDAADFGKIIADIQARRAEGKVQTQEASEAEEEAAAVSEAPAGAIRTAEVVSVTTNEVAKQNAQIQI